MLCTVAQVKQWLADDPATLDAYDTYIGYLIDAVTGLVTEYCGRSFDGVGWTYAVAYVGEDGRVPLLDARVTPPAGPSETEVWLRPALDLTGGTQLTEGTDYRLGPKEGEWGWTAQRYHWCELRPGSAVSWSPGDLVKVVHYFGYVNRQGEVPYCVRRAAVMLAARLWARRERRLGGVMDATTGTVEGLIEQDPDIVRLLRPFVHPWKSGLA